MKITNVLLALAAAVVGVDSFQFSNVTINKPADLKAKYAGGISNMPAMFGLPFSHEGHITGELKAMDDANDQACSEPTEKDKTDWKKAKERGHPLIAILERGDCTFVTKVRHAQELGAQAAIIVDNRVEAGIPYMADDGNGKGINIPSVLIHKTDGDVLLAAVTAAADPSVKGKDVMATISFNVPRPDNRVEWTFFADSAGNNADGMQNFKRSWGPVDKALGSSALFTPRYWFLDGLQLECYPPSSAFTCDNQCTNNGRYCSVDPDGELDKGISGADVVQENLRQLCFWREMNATGDIAPYWAYLNKFDSECSALKKWEDCSWKTMEALSAGSKAKVQKCIADAGGYAIKDDTENSLIKADVKYRHELQIFFRPTVLVNEQKVIGSVACQPPYSPESCGVLGAICVGFKDNKEVAACHPDPDCPIGTSAEECQKQKATTTGGSGGASSESNGVPPGLIIVIVIVCLLLVAVAVYFYMKHREDAMREDIDSLLKQYLPMQDGATNGVN